MSTSLSAIANAGFDFENIESELERVVSALKKRFAGIMKKPNQKVQHP